MKALKTYKLVSFGGTTYSKDPDVHKHQLRVANELLPTQFSQYVVSTTEPKIEEDGSLSYSGHTYYEAKNLMVTDKEYQQLKRLGVKDLTVLGVYEGESTLYTKVVFWLGVQALLTAQVVILIKVF